MHSEKYRSPLYTGVMILTNGFCARELPIVFSSVITLALKDALLYERSRVAAKWPASKPKPEHPLRLVNAF